MSVPLGYRPDRIVVLRQRTAETIASLEALGSSDPAAADATRTIRLARENLETHWMPLLTRIERSSAMISWTRSTLDVISDLFNRAERTAGRWFAYDDHDNPYSELSDDELVLELMDAQAGRNRAHYGAAPGPFDPRLARAVGSRVASDQRFANELIAAADEFPVLGAMLEHGDFPPPFVIALTRELILIPDDPTVPFAKDARSIDTSAALTFVAAHHAALALDLLNDPDVVSVLVPRSEGDRFDQNSVENFVTAGLLAAVAEDASLRADSYRALSLIVAANRDDLANIGVLRGVINALPVHMPDMLRYLDDGAGSVRPAHTDIDLGSYADLAAMYGLAMGDPAAQATAGGLITAYLEASMRSIGPEVFARNLDVDNPGDAAEFAGQTVGPLSNLVDLLFNDGIPTEQQRRNMHAGAEQATRDAWFKVFTVGPATGLPLLGASIEIRTVFKVVGIGGDLVDDVVAEVVDDSGFRFTIPHHVRTIALELVGNAPQLYAMAHIAQMSPAGISLVAGLATKLAGLESPQDRMDAMRDLDDLDDADRVIIDRFLDQAVDSSGADDNADIDVWGL